MYLDVPCIGKLEKKYLAQAIDDGYVSTAGPYIPKFENKFAKYVGAKRVVSTQSGTAAIYMALYELGIGRGDEVIVPALTFVATVNPIVHVGAKPVFADVNPETWNIEPREIEKCITKKTKAIIPVHLYGNPCDMKSILALAKKYKLFVIEDATESVGAKYLGKHTGTLGDLGCFSFNGNKIITTGGGGMIAGSDIKRLNHIKFLVNQARDESKGYYHPEVGFNYRMTNIEAALGLAQMQQLKYFLKIRKLFNSIYRKELEKVNIISFQKEYENAASSWWLTCIKFKKDINMASLQKELQIKGVPTRRIFIPVVEFPPYKKYKKSNYANSYSIFNSGLCLPGSVLNSTQDIYQACKIIKDVLNR